MVLNVINYAGGLGGVPRFTAEILGGLRENQPGAAIRFVSHGDALKQYAAYFRQMSLDVELRDLKPAGYWRSSPKRLGGIRGTGTASIYLSSSICRWGFQIPPAATADCDVAWIPSLNALELPAQSASPLVCTVHDLIQLEKMSGLPAPARRSERRLLRRALDSPAHFATSSQATVAGLRHEFQVAPDRIRVIPTSGRHHQGRETRELPTDWGWAQGRFLLFPAHLVPYKNHKYLVREIARAGRIMPLVLTGGNTHLPALFPRSIALKRAIASAGLQLGRDVIPLGYLPDILYRALLNRAFALVMPTLAEGGGSFPVEEAIVNAVPVLCSDIPVMREHVGRIGAQVIWFNASNPGGFASALASLEANYAVVRSLAREQVSRLTTRTWRDVAAEYLQLFEHARETGSI